MAERPEQTAPANALSMKTKVFLLLGTPIIVILICSIVIYYSAQSIVENDVYEETPEVLEIEGTDTADGAAAYIDGLLNDAMTAGTVKLNGYTSVSLGDFGGENVSGSQAKLLGFMAGSIGGGIGGKYYENVDEDFGGDTSSLGEVKLFPGDGEYNFEVKEDSDTVAFTFENKAPSDEAAEYYKKDTETAAKALTDYAGVFEAEDVKAELASLKTYAEADGVKNELLRIETTRTYAVTLTAKFIGSYAELGAQTLNFNYTVRDNFDVKFAGISIGQDEIRINKNGYDNVQLDARVSDKALPEEFSLTYSSSDESVVTVDENGMVEAQGIEREEPVTVTATLDYLGHTYTAEVPVYVIEPVDSVKTDPHTATVAVGQTVQINAVLNPKNATIRGVKWFSEDESILTVDENGLVTAVAPGSTQVVAVTVDGSFMTACPVTVTE